MRFSEDNLQTAVARYLDLLRADWFHVANERQTSIKRGARLKAKGVKAGVPDIIILNQRHGFSGLIIELKVKPNRVSPAQKNWLQTFERYNYKTAVCFDIDEALKTIDDYFGKKKVS